MSTLKSLFCTSIFLLCFTFLYAFAPPTISGELRKWHKVTLEFAGPNTSETANPNPYRDYRLNVTFTNGNTSYVVPGYYAADGNAAESGAQSGNKWLVHFAPDKTGTWTYTTSFRQGSNVAVNLNASAGSSAGFMDGETGTIQISATNKTGRDHRAKGRLEYVGEHYLQFQETGEYFVKGGSDAPENTLAYNDFDSTPNRGNRLKNWQPHQVDYVAGDAQAYTWQNGKGSELLGAVKYLSDKGMNVMSFLTLSLHGDDENVFPHLLKVPISTYNGYNDAQQWANGVHHDRFDVSKLAQWEKIFEYADKKGLFLHFKTLETENDNIMDNNAFGIERQLYYRELIARFSHHLGINWNLSEEITLSTTVINQTATYIKAVDPYDHIVVFHTFPAQKSKYASHYGPNNSVDGASIQTGDINNEGSNRNDLIAQVTQSANAGKKWVVGYDEPGTAGIGVDNDPDAIKDVRHKVVWNALMSGSCGVEFYYGYQTSCTDLTCQDHRTRDQKYTHVNHALQFFTNYLPFEDMKAMDNVTSQGGDYVFGDAGQIYAVYRPNGGNTGINLPAGSWQVQWYNPRNGGALSAPTTITNQLTAPDNNDWAALITVGCQPQGTACNDGNSCTTQDVYDNDCNCAGTALPDSDNDGVCNSEDVCPGGDDTVDIDNDNIPDACDDCIGNSSGSIEISATDDAYLQGGTRFNANILRVENGSRVAYLKFDLSSISDPITQVSLQLSTETDGGNGTIQVYASNNTNWTEANLTTANAPGNDQLVGNFSGSYTVGSSYTATLSGVNTNAPFSLILVQAAGGNDVAFASSEFATASKHPKLLVAVEGDCIEEPPDPTCNGFAEENGLVVIEAENLPLGNTDWTVETSFTGYTGDSYIVWRGANFFNSPGTGIIEANINISNPGTYRIQWRNRIGQGSNTTEHNDSWLRFPDASEFFAQKGASIIYPKGSGQTPNPMGSSADGWFKVYLSGSAVWSWSTRTSDNQGYEVYARFDNPGNYKMQISGRSFNHVIDRITLAKTNVANQGLNLPETECDDTSTCTIGGACNDGDVCTTGETWDANCNCNGGSFADQDGDGVCDSDDQCPGLDDDLINTACNDGNACTVNDVYTASCACVGQLVDSDNDGVCDSDDICPGGDDTIDIDNDNIPDACDSCVNTDGRTIELDAIDDAYLQGGTRFNNAMLRVENGSRVSYLKFDLSSIPQSITAMELKLTTESDPGNGTVQVFASNNTNWTEANLTTANAPGNDQLVGSFTGSYALGTTYTASLTGVNSNGQLSIILVHSPGGNDVAFASSEFSVATQRPKLVVTVAGGDCDTECLPFINNTNNAALTTSLSAVDYIKSNNVIPSNATVDFTAGQSIEMTSGFEVKNAAVYHAYIYNCGSNRCFASSLQGVRDCLNSGQSATLTQDIVVSQSDCQGNGVINVSGLQDVGIYGQGYRIYRGSGQQTCSLLYGANTKGFFSEDVLWEEVPGPEVPPLNTYKRMLHFVNSEDISFEKSEVAHSWGYALYLKSVDGFKFNNSIFRDSGVLGLYVGHGSTASTNVEIRNNTFIRNTTNAIALLGAKNVVIENNIFDNNHLIGVFSVAPQYGTGYTGGGQVYIAQADQVLFTNNTIQNGTCSNCYSTPNLGTHVTGLELGLPNQGLTVTNMMVSNNTIINNHAWGIYVNANATLDSTSQFCGNTLSGNGISSGGGVTLNCNN